MQIQSWEGAALSGAETVLQGTTHDSVRAEIGYDEEVSQRLWSKKCGRRDRFDAEAQRCAAPDGRRVFELERVVLCRRADPWWRTKLDFGSGESFDDLRSSTLTKRVLYLSLEALTGQMLPVNSKTAKRLEGTAGACSQACRRQAQRDRLLDICPG